MNVKRIFGTLLTLLGIISLVYTGMAIIRHSKDYTTMIVVGILGLIFFIAGIGLIQNTKDEA